MLLSIAAPEYLFSSTDYTEISCSGAVCVTKKEERFFKKTYVECINICKCVWCMLKSAMDLVTLYLANNLIASHCSFTGKCIKRHCRKDYKLRYFPHRPVTKQQYFGIMFDFLLNFQQVLKKAEKIFLRQQAQRNCNTTVMLWSDVCSVIVFCQ